MTNIPRFRPYLFVKTSPLWHCLNCIYHWKITDAKNCIFDFIRPRVTLNYCEISFVKGSWTWGNFLEIVLLSNFFWNLAWLTFMIWTFMIWTLKKCNKKMGSLCLFTRQRALKTGYFYWLRVKNSNYLHTELSLGYPKDKVLSWN